MLTRVLDGSGIVHASVRQRRDLTSCTNRCRLRSARTESVRSRGITVAAGLTTKVLAGRRAAIVLGAGDAECGAVGLIAPQVFEHQRAHVLLYMVGFDRRRVRSLDRRSVSDPGDDDSRDAR